MKDRKFLTNRLIPAALLIWALGGCVEPYMPEVLDVAQNSLVVNGFINSQGPTTIQLTRSLQLTDTAAAPAERGATVFIQDDAGRRYPLAESSAGTYTSAVQALDPARRYQLRINTTDRHEYATDLMGVKAAPPIDNVSWKFENDGVQLYLSTHDDSRASVYYRWRYAETWEFNSAYESRLEYVNGMLERRRNSIYHCWRTDNSTVITQTNTLRLSQDAVRDFPLLFLSSRSQKLPFKYSILVQQYSQTKEEFDYWAALKKNTESLGGINDPLPTQLTGNVHNVSDPSEAVLGYIGAHSVSTRRIFIDRSELPLPYGWRFETGYEPCKEIQELFPLPPDPPQPVGVTYVFDVPQLLPVDYLRDTVTHTQIVGYTGGTAECVDCRVRGTTVKPSYWP